MIPPNGGPPPSFSRNAAEATHLTTPYEKLNLYKPSMFLFVFFFGGGGVGGAGAGVF